MSDTNSLPAAADRGLPAPLRRLALAVALALAAAAPGARADTDVVLGETQKRWTGDLPGIAERGILRVAVPLNPLFIAFDGERISGLAVARAEQLSAHLEAHLGREIDVLLMPLPRDRLIPAVIEGSADMADANLTVTEARAERVAFSDPIRRDVRELVLTGPGAPPIESLDDLVETGLHLRASSSYAGHLAVLNAAREAAGKAAIPVVPVAETLEDHALIEMVEEGLVAATVVDSHKAALWRQVYEDVTVHETLAINEGGETAFALRRDAVALKALLDGFVADIRVGTLIGNILDKRFLEGRRRLEALDPDVRRRRIGRVRSAIRRHAETYGFDWLTILAQAFQESRLDPEARSDRGAVGVMQVLPSTARDPNVGVADISDVDGNVRAGVKYMRFLQDRYFDDPALAEADRLYFTLAAYNAGPANIRKARRRAETLGLDPDQWRDNVELAVARSVGDEPVRYVRSVVKYAVIFRLGARTMTGGTTAPMP